MLTMPPGASPIASIIGIDPGSETLGVAVLRFNFETWEILSSQAWTNKGSKLAGKENWTGEIHGDRAARIEAHEAELLHLFRWLQPLEIASESPFFNHLHPSAYGPLVEVISAIRRAVMRYDVWQQLYLIDPPTVKLAAGLRGIELRKGGKEGKLLMLRAVLALAPFLNFCGPVPLDQLDEHSIDALAVAYCRFLRLREESC